MRNLRLYVKDISAAMVAVQEFIEEIDFETFLKDDKTTSAVVRKLEIIGEATKNVPDAIRRKYPQVPWKECEINSSIPTLILTMRRFGKPSKT